MPSRRSIDGQPRLRSDAARAAWNRSGGAHGGTAKQQLRRDRKTVKQSLRKEQPCSD